MPTPSRVSPPFVGLLAAVAIAVGINACDSAGTSPANATPEPTAPAGLDASSWTIAAIGGATLPPGRPATLTLEPGGRVSGETGCNRFTGTVSVDGPAVTFGPLGTTRMACEPPLVEQEAAVLDALAGVTGWFVEADGTLHLSGTTELVLTPGVR